MCDLLRKPGRGVPSCQTCKSALFNLSVCRAVCTSAMWTYHALLLFVCTLVAVNTGKTERFSLVSVWMFYFNLSVPFVVHVCIFNRRFGFMYFFALCGSCLYF